MAQLWTTGPVHIFCGVGPSHAPLYLGTGEQAPRIDEEDENEPAMNDLSGSRDGHDESFQGTRAMIRVDLNRWNEAVMARVRAVPDAGGTGGIMDFGSMGALWLTENLAYPVWLQFPYSTTKAAYAAAVDGYRFQACIPRSRGTQPGTRARKISLVWQAKKVYIPATGGHLLYDHSMVGLPAVD